MNPRDLLPAWCSFVFGVVGFFFADGGFDLLGSMRARGSGRSAVIVRVRFAELRGFFARHRAEFRDLLIGELQL